MDLNDAIAEAERTMKVAAAKAPADVDAFAPYLRAAIAYWRLRAEAATDEDALVEATTERIISEEQFRTVAGRSFHVTKDAIDYSEASALP